MYTYNASHYLMHSWTSLDDVTDNHETPQPTQQRPSNIHPPKAKTKVTNIYHQTFSQVTKQKNQELL